VSKKK